MDRGARWATAHGVAKESNTTKQLNKTAIQKEMDALGSL